MGRTSKLFPLAGRKASVTSQSSASNSKENQPPLSKAERLLGATGLQDASRHQTSRRPSYMSFNPSISELGDEHDYDDFSTPDHFGLEPLPLRLADLQNSSTKDGLGRRISSSGSYSRSFISNHSRRIKGSWSSATLKSHYDTGANVPSNASQQTSNSAVRERASRRGMLPVFEASDNDRRRPSTASVTSTAYEYRDSMDRATALPDITRLHSKFGSTPHIPRVESRGTDSALSTSHMPTPSLRFPGAAPTSRPNTSTGSIRKAAGTAGRTLKVRLSTDGFSASMKLFSRRQQASAPSEPTATSKSRRGAAGKNWWDKYPLEADDSDAQSEHDLDLVTPTGALFPPNARGGPSPRSSDVHLNSSERLDTVYTIRKMGSAHEIVSARSSTTVRSPHTHISRGSRPSSRIAVNDLHETSILSTSSSSDTESEPGTESGDDLPRNRDIRDSIAVSEIDVHHIGQAQAMHVTSMRRIAEDASLTRRPSVASVSSNPTTADSSSVKSSNNGQSYLSVPNRSSRSRKSGHTRQPSSIPEDSDTSSQVASPTSPPASMHSFGAPQGEHRKLMAVTEEEEALLELMRRKRADKAAQRDSGLASIQSSSTTRSSRPFSNLSASSSILDSFPLSRSQRSSLLASRATTQQSPPPEHGSASKESKRQSVATTATDNTYYSIDTRLESPKRLKYAFTPHLSLASLDVSLSGLPSPTSDEPLVSTSEPSDTPATPLTRRGSADVLIREASSQRNSVASYAYGERPQPNEEILQSKLEEKLRRKTTSNATPHSSPDLSKSKKLKADEASLSLATSSDEEQSPKIGADDNSSMASSKRASTLSKNTSECGSGCGHFSHNDSAGYNRNSVGYGAGVGTRCSVSEDVLAAWGSLGGWRDIPGVMG